MCLIFVSFQQHHEFPLIVAANRDEFYARPSKAIHQWQDDSNIIAGRDIEQGGTWLGLSRKGRFAAVTNYRNGTAQENRKSRGQLVHELLSTDEPKAFMHSELASNARQYNDFNCLYYYRQELYYLNNKSYLSNKNLQAIKRLDPGIYGVSNALLDTPWPKLANGKAEFSAAAAQPGNEDAFWKLLIDDTPAADKDLPNTGISPEWEKLLSSRFIRSADYGTRSSSLLTWSALGNVKLSERRYDARGFIEENTINLQVKEHD